MEIICPNCNVLYRNIPEKFSHRSVRCKKCNHRFTAAEGVIAPQETQLAATEPVRSPQETQLASAKPVIPPQETQLASAEPAISPQETQLASAGPAISPQETQLASAEPVISPQETQLISRESESSQQTQIVSAESNLIKASQTVSGESLAKEQLLLVNLKRRAQQSTLSKMLCMGSAHFSCQRELAEQSVHDWQIGELLLELYEVKKLLGEGQFGKVFQVRHRDWNIDLALKTPKKKALAAGYDTIEKEAETWVNLDLHPNIVNCYYVRRIDGIPQIFSEFVDGGDLKSLISSKKLYSKDNNQKLFNILDIAIQFAWGLHYAHEQGLIHQDVKPANVMITSSGIIKITDFGLAKAGAMANISGQSKNQTIVINGMGMTPAYASPEQLAAKVLTRRTDLWSWGVCVLEMLLGYCSWEAGTVAPGILEAYINHQLDDEPAVASIPDALANLLASCFEEKQSDRPVNLNDVAEALVSIYQQESGEEYPRQQPQEGNGTASSLNNQAISLLDLGKSDEAIKSWNAALSINSRDFETNHNILLYNWKNNGLDESELLSKVESFLHKNEEYSSKEKNKERIKTALAKLYLQFSYYTKAIKILNNNQKDITQLPAGLSNDGYKMLGLALCAEYRLVESVSKWELVVECLKKVIVNNETDPYSITAYTLALQRSGEKKQADDFFRHNQSTGIIPAQLKQATALFLPGYEAIYHIAMNKINHAEFIQQDEQIVFSQGNVLLFWDLKEKQIIRRIKGHLSEITCFTISFDGKTIISGSKQGNIRVWDIETGRLQNVWSAHEGKINVLKISSCDQFLFVSTSGKSLGLWDFNKKTRIKSFFGEGHGAQINDIQQAPSGDFIASAGADSVIRIWDKTTGHTNKILSGHDKAIHCIKWLDDQTILSGSEDKTLRMWDIHSGECLRIFTGHLGIVTSIDVDQENHFFISGSSDGKIRFWDIKSGLSYVTSQFSNSINYLSLDCSKLFVLVVTSTGISIIEPHNSFRYRVPYLFSLPESAVEIDQLARKYQNLINQANLAITKNNHLVALEEIEKARSLKGYKHDHSAFKYWSRLYSVFPRQKLMDIWKYTDLSIHNARITSLSVSSVDGTIYTAGKDKLIYQLNIETQSFKTIFGQFDQEISMIIVSEDGRGMLVACGYNVLVMDIKSGKQLSLFCHHTANVVAMSYSADGRFALSSDARGNFYLWRLLTGEIMADFTDTNNQVIEIAVTPDGRFAITGHRNNNHVAIWELSIGKVISVLQEHKNIVTSIAVTSNGRYFISGSADNTLRLWQVQSSRKKSIRIMRGHTKRINQVTIDYQNKIAFSVSEDKSIRIWDINTGDCIRNFDNLNSAYTSAIITMSGQYAISGDPKGAISIWCLDWLMDKKQHQEWDINANIYLINYLATHKTAEPHKELNAVLRIFKYAGYGWLDKNDVGLKLLYFYQSNINTVLPASKLSRTAKSNKQKSSRKKLIISLVSACILAFGVLIIRQNDNSLLESDSREMESVELVDENEQLTIDKMLDIAVLLSRLNKNVGIISGRLDTRSLVVPSDINEFQKTLKLDHEDLLDAWGKDFAYLGVKTGTFKGRIILRSAGIDQEFKTDDDFLLNGYPHWNSLVIRKNNQALIRLSEYKKTLQEQDKEQLNETKTNVNTESDEINEINSVPENTE